MNLGSAEFVIGDVKVTTADNKSKRVAKGFEFFGGETVTTSRGSVAKIRLKNDSLVKVMPNSVIKLNKVQFHQDKNKFAFGVLQGGMSNEVNKLGKDDYYRVYTPSAVAGVRGTEFQVVVGRNGNAKVTVTEGEIALEGQESKASLKPGEKAEMSLDSEINKGKADEGDFEKEYEDFDKKNQEVKDPVNAVAVSEKSLRLITVRNRQRVAELRKKKNLAPGEQQELEFLYQRSVNQGEFWYSLSANVFKKHRANRLIADKIKGNFYKVQRHIKTIEDQITDMDNFIEEMSKQIDDFTEDTGSDIDDMTENFINKDKRMKSK